ncbi:MAG TPA: co-chaperone GroES [Chloroflexia bacterium]|nr:co-chaperone GroES [Chloroflexia bacterium]
MADTATGTKTHFRPLGDRVVVKALEREQQTSSGIYLPDTVQEKPQEATVIAVGPGKLLDNGTRAPIDVKEGDRVLFSKYAGTEVKQLNEEYMILRESDILAVIEG